MLLTVAMVIIGSLWLLSYNVVYTQGEVMQALFTCLVCLITASVLAGLYRRKAALWCLCS